MLGNLHQIALPVFEGQNNSQKQCRPLEVHSEKDSLHRYSKRHGVEDERNLQNTVVNVIGKLEYIAKLGQNSTDPAPTKVIT